VTWTKIRVEPSASRFECSGGSSKTWFCEGLTFGKVRAVASKLFLTSNGTINAETDRQKHTTAVETTMRPPHSSRAGIHIMTTRDKSSTPHNPIRGQAEYVHMDVFSTQVAASKSMPITRRRSDAENSIVRRFSARILQNLGLLCFEYWMRVKRDYSGMKRLDRAVGNVRSTSPQCSEMNVER